MKTDPGSTPVSAPTQSAAGCLARLFWTIAGNVALVFSAMYIVLSPSTIGLPDLVYWAVGVSLVAVRYVDVARLGGTTSEGEPATMSDWRRYAAMVLGIGAAAWAVAHLASYLLGK